MRLIAYIIGAIETISSLRGCSPKSDDIYTPRHQQDLIPDVARPETGTRGVQNLGLTCYIGSVLQVLSHTPAFADTIMRIPSGPARSAAEGVLESFQEYLIASVYEPSIDPIDPFEFIQSLQAFSGGLDLFQIGHPDDANMALSFLLNALMEAVVARTGSADFLTATIGKPLRVFRECARCRRQREGQDPEIFRMLNIAGPGDVTLEQVLINNLRTYVDANCATCARDTPHETRVRLADSPVVIMSLNRYLPDGSWDGRSVRIPLTLNMRTVDAKTRGMYRLTGVVRYHGDHYTADFLHAETGMWLHGDDSRVFPCRNNVPKLHGPQPYILTYQRTN